MEVKVSDLVDGGRIYEYTGERFLTVVYPPERGLIYFVIESDYKPSKTGIIPNMEALAQLLLWVDGYMDLFPEDQVITDL